MRTRSQYKGAAVEATVKVFCCDSLISRGDGDFCYATATASPANPNNRLTSTPGFGALNK
jgi:hypothetical protein